MARKLLSFFLAPVYNVSREQGAAGLFIGKREPIKMTEEGYSFEYLTLFGGTGGKSRGKATDCLETDEFRLECVCVFFYKQGVL